MSDKNDDSSPINTAAKSDSTSSVLTRQKTMEISDSQNTGTRTRRRDPNETCLSFTYGSYASIRYFFVRMLCCPIPFIPQTLPIIGGKTILEIIVSILVMLIVAAMVLTRPDANDMGVITQYIGVVMILLALRRISFMSLFGISFERSLYWHKLMALCYLFALMNHGIREGMNSTGVTIGVFSGATTLIYASAYMNFSFNLFYYFHIMAYIIIAPLAVIHGGKFFGYIAAVWGADLFVRYLLQGKRIDNAKLTYVADGLVKLEIYDNPFHPTRSSFALQQPGMYCFVMVPKINYYEYHPFTIATNPADDQLTFYIKAEGDWTSKLRDIAKEGAGGENGKTSDVKVYLEGPYGNLSIDMFNPNTHPVAMLISGGVGITPMLSCLRHYIHLASHGNLTGMKRVIFVWVCREEKVANLFYNSFFIPLCLQYFTPAPLKECEGRPDLADGSLWMLRSCSSYTETDNDFCALQNDDLRFEFHYYLTRGKVAEIRPTVDYIPCDASMGHGTGVMRTIGFFNDMPITERERASICNPLVWKECRPALENYYATAAKIVGVHGSTCNKPRISAAVCGPDPLVHNVRNLNVAYSAKTGVTFDLHEEFFNF